MKEGKLNHKFLKGIISKYLVQDESMVISPGVGIDCTVFDNGIDYIVATSDPVTFFSSGEYCVNANLNDIVAMGAKPWFFMATIILPPKTKNTEFELIMSQIKECCEQFDINFGGGHTEINTIVDKPLISGFMVGRCPKDRLKGSFNAKDEDIVLLTKGVSVEGISIIAEYEKDRIINKFGPEFFDKCVSFKKKLSVAKEAYIASEDANAMHDVTEGGLINSLYEIAIASNVSIELSSLPVLDETKIICKEFGIDPLGLISSGSLLITTKNESLEIDLRNSNVETFRIGKVLKDNKKEVRFRGSILKMYDADEIIKITGDVQSFS